ncbi:MAG: hypothetical protein LBC92_02350 [Rickettsiales bacterium]|jgi:hypothetical protein|nr:hypothetical protein [Rickettsiales bacterium]
MKKFYLIIVVALCVSVSTTSSNSMSRKERKQASEDRKVKGEFWKYPSGDNEIYFKLYGGISSYTADVSSMSNETKKSILLGFGVGVMYDNVNLYSGIKYDPVDTKAMDSDLSVYLGAGYGTEKFKINLELGLMPFYSDEVYRIDCYSDYYGAYCYHNTVKESADSVIVFFEISPEYFVTEKDSISLFLQGGHSYDVSGYKYTKFGIKYARYFEF